jgi:hypothetical protein
MTNFDPDHVSQAIAELVHLHEDVLAHLFAFQTLLQDLGLISASQASDRIGHFRQQFSEHSDAGILDLAKRLDAEERLWRRQVLEEYTGPKQ